MIYLKKVNCGRKETNMWGIFLQNDDNQDILIATKRSYQSARRGLINYINGYGPTLSLNTYANYGVGAGFYWKRDGFRLGWVE